MAYDAFLRITESIDGESTDADHEKWIEVLSYSHGVSQPVSWTSGTGGLAASKADFQDLTIVKTLDTSTPNLNVSCAEGKPIDEVELHLCLTTGKKHPFMKYILRKCFITSVSAGGSAGEETKPLENVTFAYKHIIWEYTPIDDQGNPGATTGRDWSIKQNKKDGN